ncbi:MAG: hypothetical protein LWX52_16660 [Deltaproteobacteria bacterium]|jgi:hypothetical protein|nr:hypothetical protein [Deltaproteobacteria bacterium]
MLDNFMGFFRRQLEVVNALGCTSNRTASITGQEDVTLYKKIAYVSLLDCFASLRFHKAAYGQLFRQNNKRFTRFLGECAGWRVGGLISLAFLSDRLPKASSDGRLAKHINKKLTNLGNSFGDSVSAEDVDEEPEGLLELASTETEEEAVLYCQHYSIMYRYRNNLVHQARRPGGAAELLGEDQTEALYHTYAGDSTVYLLYPIGLFKRLCMSSLENLGRYLTENKLDPHSLEDDQRCF